MSSCCTEPCAGDPAATARAFSGDRLSGTPGDYERPSDGAAICRGRRCGSRRRRWTPRDRYKRPFDLALVALAIVALLPLWLLLGVAIPLAIRLEDGGPVLYRQPRLGRDGRVFDILKFRTMVEGAEDRTGPVRAVWRDARITAVGRMLRRFHLDELPQAVNILRGEMSVVGPRPERLALAERFERETPGFSRRLRVRPGVMGLAQALGRYHSSPRAARWRRAAP